jgi:histidinol-phosphate aminotransferase
VWLSTGEETLAAAQAFEDGGVIVRPFAGDGIRISVGEAEAVDKVLEIAASVLEGLPEGHAGRGISRGLA